MDQVELQHGGGALCLAARHSQTLGHPTIGVVVLKRLEQLISLRMSELRRLLTATIRDYEHPPEAQREN